MTSYRDYETNYCVGVQLFVESDRGLCVYHKPNRLITERKRFFLRVLRMQGP